MPGGAVRYLDPTVQSRLIDYYASDDVFSSIQRTLEIAETLPELAKFAPDVRELLEIKNPLKSITDELMTVDPETGKTHFDHLKESLSGAFFTKIADLVGAHSNLMWYANPDVVSAAYPIFQRSDSLQEINDFVKGKTPGGSSRWDMLQVYLSDDWFSEIKSIIDIDGSLLLWLKDRVTYLDDLVSRHDNIMTLTGDTFDELVDLASRHSNIASLFDALSSRANTEGVSFSTISDRLSWLASSIAVSGLSHYVTNKDTYQEILDMKRDLDDIVAKKSRIITLTSDSGGHTFTELVDLAGKHSDIVGLVDEKASIDVLVNRVDYIKGFIDGLKGVADSERISYSTVVDRMTWYAKYSVQDELYDLTQIKSGIDELYAIRDKLKGLADNKSILDWYSRDDVSSIIGDLVSNGKLPTIEAKAVFNKDVDIKGKLNKLSTIRDWIRSNIDPLHFTMGAFDLGWLFGRTVHPHWDTDEDWGYGLTGFRNWLNHMKWLIGEIRAKRYPASYICQFPIHFAAGLPFLEKIADFIDKLKSAWG